MEIVRNPDGTLVVPIPPERQHEVDDASASDGAAAEGGEVLPAHEATKIIGEVLAELD